MPNLQKTQGAELGILSKLLFDNAVSKWYSALTIEIVAGLLAAIIGLFALSDQLNVTFAIIGFGLLVIAYNLKIQSSVVYDRAETMRRQTILTEALGWPIDKNQFSDWRLLAGKKILKKLENTPVDPTYYASQATTGPKRLLEMTRESAFWTKHLYIYLKRLLWIAFAVSLFFFVMVLTFAASDVVQPTLAVKITYLIYLLLPLVLTADVFGGAIKLGQIIESIRQIENDLDRLAEDQSLNEQKILRLVAEYNCQVVNGFPIPTWFFKRYHDHIAFLWEKRLQ